jgi:hypothetical protein
MSVEPVRHLHPVEQPPLELVDRRTGEAFDLDAHMQSLEDHIKGLQRDVKAEHMRYENLRRDKEREAKESAYWPFVYRLFKYWVKACGKSSRYQFKTDRFELALEHVRHDPLLCAQAIAGAAFDPWYPPPGKNGKSRPQNGWHHIFKNSERLQDFADRAPTGWQPPKGFAEALEQESWYRPKAEKATDGSG